MMESLEKATVAAQALLYIYSTALNLLLTYTVTLISVPGSLRSCPASLPHQAINLLLRTRPSILLQPTLIPQLTPHQALRKCPTRASKKSATPTRKSKTPLNTSPPTSTATSSSPPTSPLGQPPNLPHLKRRRNNRHNPPFSPPPPPNEKIPP